MRYLFIAPLLFGLAACGNNIQTSSGADYLSKHPLVTNPADGDINPASDQAVLAAASVEPILRFPARIGIARIESQQLATIPPDELAIWAEVAGRHSEIGEFVPVSPLVAEFTAESVQPYPSRDLYRRTVGELVGTIRLGAARQHVDAVLVYGVAASSRSANTPLAFADITLIGGAILPTRRLKGQGIGQALLLDVRNGYPYGTASAQVDLTGLSVSWGSDERSDELRREATLEMVRELTNEVEEMFGKLAKEMKAR